MRDWFMSREPRERVVLVVGGVAAAVIVFWGLVWTPLARGSAELHASVAHKSSLLVNVQRAAALNPAAARGPARAAPDSMVVLVDKTSREHGLASAFTHTRPDGRDGINVTFQNASFDALVAWLLALKSEYGVNVESASFNGTQSIGLVSGQVLLRRS